MCAGTSSRGAAAAGEPRSDTAINHPEWVTRHPIILHIIPLSFLQPIPINLQDKHFPIFTKLFPSRRDRCLPFAGSRPRSGGTRVRAPPPGAAPGHHIWAHLGAAARPARHSPCAGCPGTEVPGYQPGRVPHVPVCPFSILSLSYIPSAPICCFSLARLRRTLFIDDTCKAKDRRQW